MIAEAIDGVTIGTGSEQVTRPNCGAWGGFGCGRCVVEAVGEYLRSQVQSGDSGHVRCDSVISVGSFGSASLVYNGRRNITDEVKRMA